MKDGFLKVAAATPSIRVADCLYNARQIVALMQEAETQGVKILALPELCLTGKTCGDLFFQRTLLDGAMDALRTILQATKDCEVLTALGMPLRADGKLVNAAVLVQRGRVVAVSAKTVADRWFAAPEQESVVQLSGICEESPEEWPLMRTDTCVEISRMEGLRIGVVLGEDLCATDPLSRKLAEQGATVILNLSADAELVGRAEDRRQQAAAQSGRLCCSYLLANAGEGESTTDMVFGGHNLVAEYGRILAESRFATGITAAVVDVQKLTQERRRLPHFPCHTAPATARCTWTVTETDLTGAVNPMPFLPQGETAFEDILTLAALGLKQRLAHTNAKTAVLGLSGGLDSTLALLIVRRAMALLGRPMTDIVVVTMPCFGTTGRTRNNAVRLAERVGATLRTIPIGETVASHFKDIGHSMEDHSVTFENAQARERTQVLMDVANQCGGLVIGTGDLSELALGWATYNGDHMSMYGVNGSIPKTLVRRLVSYAAQREQDGELSRVLEDILDTPVSPELLPPADGEISQCTENLVGPYELHDFFLYEILRWGFSPCKIFRMAESAWGSGMTMPQF